MVLRDFRWNGSWQEGAWFGEKPALTPALSPGEREKQRGVLGNSEVARALPAFSLLAETTSRPLGAFVPAKRGGRFSLSPGERAGVRAGLVRSAPVVALSIPLE